MFSGVTMDEILQLLIDYGKDVDIVSTHGRLACEVEGCIPLNIRLKLIDLGAELFHYWYDGKETTIITYAESHE